MKRTYAILRHARGSGEAPRLAFRGPPGAMGRVPEAMAGAEAAGAEPEAEPKIEVNTLETREAGEAHRDPGVRAVAPIMPTILIAPLAGAEAAASAPAWGIGEVGAATTRYDGAGIPVAVLDTGIDAGHPAFQGLTLDQRDFTGTGNGDGNGHGTHCAGTILGRDVNGTRIGIARGVTKALVGKVLDGQGRGSSDALYQGMQWALGSGARVVSMSIGFDFPGLVKGLVDQGWPVELATSSALETYRANLRMFDAIMAIAEAKVPIDGGAVVVAAAGNESRRNVNPDFEIAASLPAAAEHVLSVGALGQGPAGLRIAPFSNTLPVISAPGVDIVSAKRGGGLVALSGTSMATPHVAGLAALWWQALPDLHVPVNAITATARLVANARTDRFDPGVEISDRGAGLAVAPA